MTKQEKKGLVEESATLKISDFGKKLLYAEYGDESCPNGEKRGSFCVGRGKKAMRVKYEYSPMVAANMIYVETIRESDGQTSYQDIGLGSIPLSYGLRPYFICPNCGKGCNNLYIAKYDFLYCRDCQNLTYELTRVKKTSLKGFAYPITLIDKLNQKQKKVKRIYYNSKMTKRAKAAMRASKKFEATAIKLGMEKDSQ